MGNRCVIFGGHFLQNASSKLCSKKLNIQFGSSSSHGYASLSPENFEMPTIKFEMKNYRNVKSVPFGSIYFQNSIRLNWRSNRRENFTQYALAGDLSIVVGRNSVKNMLRLVLAKYLFALMLSLWEMGASYSEAIFSKMPRQSCL